MKKFFLILFILIILLIIYHYSRKENFFSSTFTVDKIGLDNLNNYSPIRCSVNKIISKELNITNNEFNKCFIDENKDKYIELDTENNKCNIYDKVTCGDDNDGQLLNNLNSPSKILFRTEFRTIL